MPLVQSPPTSAAEMGGTTTFGQSFDEIFAQLDPDQAHWMLSLIKECEQSPDRHGPELLEQILSDLDQRFGSRCSSARGTSPPLASFSDGFVSRPESPPIPIGASLFTPTESHFSFKMTNEFSKTVQSGLAQIQESSEEEPGAAAQSRNKLRLKVQEVPQSDRNLRSYSRVLRSADAKKRVQYLERWGGDIAQAKGRYKV